MADLQFCYRGFGGESRLYGANFIDVLSHSSIGLNISRSTGRGEVATCIKRYLYSSERIAQLMGNGCLTFIEDIFGLDDLYSSDEVVFFSGKDDLKQKIRYYADHHSERQRIAKNGWLKAHQKFSTDLVTRYMVERLMQQPLSYDYAWPVKAIIKK